MLVMGDEVRRSQRGNNNAYCQDNEISWFDWSLLEQHGELHRFVKLLIDYRRRLPEREDQQLTLTEVIARSRVRWHGVTLDRPDWSEQSRSVAFSIETPKKWYYLIFNAYWGEIDFDLPPVPADFEPWYRIIDTDLASPHDIRIEGSAVRGTQYSVQARTSVVLTSMRREIDER
jgi:glycogen operon protein